MKEWSVGNNGRPAHSGLLIPSSHGGDAHGNGLQDSLVPLHQ